MVCHALISSMIEAFRDIVNFSTTIHEMIIYNRISLEIEHAAPLLEGLLIVVLTEVCSHKMGATQVNGSSYTLSSDYTDDRSTTRTTTSLIEN